MALTQKMERFARGVALEGLSYSAAYVMAYDTEKMAPDTINKKASELAKHGEVAARIKGLVCRHIKYETC